ncbi:sulfotransferase [Sphingomonas sp. HITSZ_GF]|uniref:sulfotransferase family protein n=1 Tax=Sphingomonas sp. HITSZ_GF TaxID=3037247 RepID=UPI00240E9640|nr:sulfotransferase [Sphingomonas sp. HITSZ_GF]MDG2533205.1 sulfotransferase [Sphingomonas sp. HITSZ_GF]
MNATSPLAAFRAALLADPAAQQQLAEPVEPDRFEAQACAWAAAQGIALTPAMLREAEQGAPLRIERCPPAGWLPAALGPDLAIEWLHFAGVVPNHPFFEIAQREARARPLNRLLRLRTTLDTLIDAPRAAGFAPAGFIFHMSRCGSTLVAQMLGAAPGHVALSEPAPLDALIRAPLGDEERHAEALRALLHAWGRSADRLFVKFDAWHTRALPLLRRAFPHVPWIFLHRDPVEVLVSHRRGRGTHTVPGLIPLDWFGLAPADAGLPETAFTARVLEQICTPAMAHAAEGGLLVDYAELPRAFFTRILPHFGLEPDARARVAMERAAARNAKEPHAAFLPDDDAKQREAGPEQHAAAARVRVVLSPSASPR